MWVSSERSEEEEDVKRIVRQSDVTWYVRDLPEGWKASPDAVAEAKRRGIPLGPNETFVREHKRGVGHPVLGHRVVKRNIAVEFATD